MTYKLKLVKFDFRIMMLVPIFVLECLTTDWASGVSSQKVQVIKVASTQLNKEVQSWKKNQARDHPQLLVVEGLK